MELLFRGVCCPRRNNLPPMVWFPDPYEQTGTAETPDNPHLPPTPAVNTNPDQAADSADFMNASSESTPDFKAQKIYNDGELAAVVDFILLQMDQNENGYVEYFEYRTFQDNFKKTEKSEPRGWISDTQWSVPRFCIVQIVCQYKHLKC